MKVTCTGCNTVYTLQKIPTRKTRATCKKCGRSFIIEPPHMEQSSLEKTDAAPQPASRAPGQSGDGLQQRRAQAGATQRRKRPKGKSGFRALALTGAALVLVAGTLVGVGSFWMGKRVEASFADNLRALSSPGSFTFTGKDYHRGLFSSAATSLVELQTGPKSYTCTLSHRIRHGPLVFGTGVVPQLACAAIETTVELPEEIRDDLSFYFGRKPAIGCTSTVELDGTVTTHITSPSYEGASKDGNATVVWHGIHGTVVGSNTDKLVDLELEVPELSIEKARDRLVIADVSVNGNFDRTPSTYWLGDLSLRAENFTFKRVMDGAVYSLQAGDIALTVKQQERENMLRWLYDFACGEVKVNDSSFKRGTCTIEFRNIDPEAITKLSKEFQILAQTKASSDPAAVKRIPESLAPLFKDLLRHSPEMEISRIGLETDRGKILGNASLKFAGDAEFDINQWELLLPRVRLDAELKLPAAYLKQALASRYQAMLALAAVERDAKLSAEHSKRLAAAMVDKQLDNLEGQGLLVRVDDHYRAKLQLAYGNLTVNGRPAEALTKGLLQ
ncbi:MAG: DUF945 family protein [Syntrophobacteria bacterium]